MDDNDNIRLKRKHGATGGIHWRIASHIGESLATLWNATCSNLAHVKTKSLVIQTRTDVRKRIGAKMNSSALR